MNKLWEEFVYRRLKKEESKRNILVKRQQSSNFWKPFLEDRSRKVRPDIVIEYADQNIIVDTKWKVLEGMIPSDEDLKQMFIYNLFWKCNKSYLLYPASKDESGYGDYHKHNETQCSRHQCGVEKFLILENNQLKKNLGSEILDKLLIAKTA